MCSIIKEFCFIFYQEYEPIYRARQCVDITDNASTGIYYIEDIESVLVQY
jgi:hypothetical protein